MPDYYARIEAVNLDYSVYDTDNISTIRGGSFMLLDVLRKLSSDIGNIRILTNNSSEFLCSFEAPDLKNAKKIFRTFYNHIPTEAKKIATFVGGVIEKSYSPTTFLRDIESLKFQNRLQQYKQLNFPLPNLQADAGGECEIDGIRPGTDSPYANHRLSTEVVIRREKGRTLKNQLYQELLGEAWLESFTDREDNKELPSKGLFFSKDLEKLSTNRNMGKLNGKIAFIYIDGNRFGKIRESISTDEISFAAFQSHLQEKVRKPALRAILEKAAGDPTFKTQKGKGALAIETLLWGGDEIEWIVPAWQALDLLDTFFREAKKEQVFISSAKISQQNPVRFLH